jgi:hypothetical protein
MAITPKWYGLGMKAIMGGAVDLDTDTLKISLHTTTYVPNQDTHDFFDDATNELPTASGYTAGGVTLTSLLLTYDVPTQQVRWDFADISWTFSASVTWRYAVIRKARGGAASADELIGWIDWGTSQTVSGPYTLQLDPTGLLFVDVT